jgi:hypothetical protein
MTPVVVVDGNTVLLAVAVLVLGGLTAMLLAFVALGIQGAWGWLRAWFGGPSGS